MQIDSTHLKNEIEVVFNRIEDREKKAGTCMIRYSLKEEWPKLEYGLTSIRSQIYRETNELYLGDVWIRQQWRDETCSHEEIRDELALDWSTGKKNTVCLLTT